MKAYVQLSYNEWLELPAEAIPFLTDIRIVKGDLEAVNPEIETKPVTIKLANILQDQVESGDHTNILHRLETLYKNRYSFDISEAGDPGFTVTIRFPFETAAPQDLGTAGMETSAA